MEILDLTIRQLMDRIGMTYAGADSLIQRMKRKGLAKNHTTIANVRGGRKNVYRLAMTPEEYLRDEQQKNQKVTPPAVFFNNPFNLSGAIDARYNMETLYD
jgi:hypothetical protein